jgi:hypothetical protein
MQNIYFSLVKEIKIYHQKEAGGGEGSAFVSLVQTGGEGGLTVRSLEGLEVNIGG